MDLSYNQLTSMAMNLPRHLLKLKLQHNSISRIPAHMFRHLRPGLQLLGLSHNALRDEGIEQGSFVGTFRSLVELLLDDNHLAEVPLWVRQFKNLQVLRLDNNYIRWDCSRIHFLLQRHTVRQVWTFFVSDEVIPKVNSVGPIKIRHL